MTSIKGPSGQVAMARRKQDSLRPVQQSDRPFSQLLSLVVHALPKGRRLSNDVWAQRHLGLTGLLCAQAPALLLFALYRHYSVLDGLYACAPVAVAGAAALTPRLDRRIRSASVAVGLVVACSVLVDLSGGAIEAHFSYFVVIAFLSLYQEWTPFLIAILFVLLEHGIVGVLDPAAVYHHPGMAGMDQDPWKWAFIHAGFVLAASFANLLAWRLTEQEALHDNLTGLPNRVLFTESVASSCQGRGRHTTAVLFIDLDNFKDANDGFGHDTGDQLLRAITTRLRNAARRGDLVARLGGDEFGVILRNIENDDQGRAAAERYLASFEQPFELGGLSLETSASIGLVHAGQESMGPHSLLRCADLAMYAAKQAGGAQIAVYEAGMHAVVVNRANRQIEMHQALKRDEFVVHYQPLVDVTTREIVGTEALVRWQHPELGLIPPVEFISIAEQSGLIVALGEWVLRTACKQTAAWHAQYPDQRPITVSVNLSPRQLSDRDVIDRVATALADSGLDAQYLCLEITESAVIKDLEGALPKLRALKAIGVSLALDDFGTGYSSLSYLRQLPVDSVKIDRSFITDLSDERNRRIVQAIIDLAHALGISVTAEGVESEEQLTALRGLASNLAQGYLLGRPMPSTHLTELLGHESGAHRLTAWAGVNPIRDGSPQ